MNTKDREFFDVNNGRYKILFSFDNAYGIFRKKYQNAEDDRDLSLIYELIYYDEHGCNTLEDVMKDIICLTRADRLPIRVNDIICIKTNGAVVSYRFLKLESCNWKTYQNVFFEVSGFLDMEKEKYILSLNQENKLLSVLDAKIYNLDEIDLTQQVVCCVDEEVFGKSEPTKSIVSDYFIYIIKNVQLKN